MKDLQVSLNATDSLDASMEGNLTMKRNFTVEIPDGLNSSEVLLNGYSVSMKCGGDQCDQGDAVWPFKF